MRAIAWGPVAAWGRVQPPFRRPARAPASSAEFDAWLAAHPLPGQQGSRAISSESSASAATGAHAARPQRHRTLPLQGVPGAAADFARAHATAHWRLEAPGVLVACSSSDDAAAPLARLALPRLLEPAAPALFASTSVQPSHLMPPPGPEQQRLRGALAALAGGGAPSVGAQLLVLLSADSAVLALAREGKLERHRVLTGYTVRRSQGKAQATHLRQGGGAGLTGLMGQGSWACGACGARAARPQPARCKLQVPAAPARHWPAPACTDSPLTIANLGCPCPLNPARPQARAAWAGPSVPARRGGCSRRRRPRWQSGRPTSPPAPCSFAAAQARQQRRLLRLRFPPDGPCLAAVSHPALRSPLCPAPVRVWNELYSSPPPPVDRRDARWRPLGLGVRRPRLADAERALAALSTGALHECGGSREGSVSSSGGSREGTSGGGSCAADEACE